MYLILLLVFSGNETYCFQTWSPYLPKSYPTPLFMQSKLLNFIKYFIQRFETNVQKCNTYVFLWFIRVRHRHIQELFNAIAADSLISIIIMLTICATSVLRNRNILSINPVADTEHWTFRDHSYTYGFIRSTGLGLNNQWCVSYDV